MSYQQSAVDDDHYMKEAIRLARKGLGKTSPNPVVGAVAVRGGEVIGRGFHKKYGDKHAEINAIEDAGGDVKGATLYVTLEPCCHHEKKTPPCVDDLIKGNIGRAVIGILDPNPLVNGRGVERLRSKGIEVTVGVREEECLLLNEAYFKYMSTGLPLITIKFAQTLDGRIATTTGHSQWISSQPFLKYVHRLRSINDCVMVGIETVLADDPKLNVRLMRGRDPVPVVVDSMLRVPLKSQILKGNGRRKPIIATTSKADRSKRSSLEEVGARVLMVEEDAEGQVDLSKLMETLGAMGLTSVLVEGGSRIITSLFKESLADKLVICIAPKILGTGLEAIGDIGITRIDDAIRLSESTVKRMGDDLILEARISFSSES
jgi:diaminohydroxyphosphoribosylaminopyrimidine deaminase/5-amino-6-(5-phosphoribosylamino)uracil reductase